MQLGTLKRWMLHPNIVVSVLWIPVLKYWRYVDHPAIKSFLEDTVPASIAADGLRLRVDYLQPSETPPNKGGRPLPSSETRACNLSNRCCCCRRQ